MSIRYPAGFIRIGYNPLKVPDAPTIGTATGGDAQADVTFTAPSNVGGAAITAYYAVSNPDQITASGTSSPVTVTGLTNGTSYTFQVWALNSYGPSPYSAASGSVSPAAALGVFAGGIGPFGANINTIQYVTISTTGNAADFGDLTQDGTDVSGFGSSTRGVYGGIYGSGNVNTINYITFSTTGNASDFGDMITAARGRAGFNSSTRGIFAGGADIFGYGTSSIEYVTIATTGNGTNFGTLTRSAFASGCSSPTRGITAESGGPSNVISYVTIATTGNATDFGDLTVARSQLASASSSTRGIFAGGVGSGSVVSNVIDYITIASAGNAIDFGDLSSARYAISGCSSSSRMVIAGSANSSNQNTAFLDYLTIASPGNSTSFGNLDITARGCGAASNANGGL